MALLTSHKQFVENGHMAFFHRYKSGIVLCKEPKFRLDDVIIPFVKHANGLYYPEEYIPGEQSAVALVAQRLQNCQMQSLFIFRCIIFVLN